MPTQPNVPLTERWSVPIVPSPVRNYFHEYRLAWEDPYGYRLGRYDSYCRRRWIAPPARFGIVRFLIWCAIFVWVAPFLIGYALAVLALWGLFVLVRALARGINAVWRRYTDWQDPDR